MKLNTKIAKLMGVLMAAVVVGAAYPKAAVNAPAHLVAAENLVAKLRTQGDNGQFTDASGVALNRYGASYKDVVMVWGPTARVNAVCSNFVTVLLEKTYPGWTARKAGFGSSSPTAAMIHDAIEANANGFVKVSEFEQIQPGDFLMAEYYDDQANTGHAMIVRDAAVVDEDEETGMLTWAVDVIDCSKSRHSNDSREFAMADGTTKTTEGAGRGVMRVLTQDGDIVGYSWSFRNGSVIYTPAQRHLTLGRLAG